MTHSAGYYLSKTSVVSTSEPVKLHSFILLKDKIRPGKLGYLTSFINWSMNRAAVCGAVQNGMRLQEERWSTGATNKRKTSIIWGLDTSSLGSEWKGFVMKTASFFFFFFFFWWGWWTGLMWQITWLVLGQEIPPWLIKMLFPGEVETAIRSGCKSRFGITDF